MLKNIISILSITVLLSGCSSLKDLFTDSSFEVRVSAEPSTAKLYINNTLYSPGSSKSITINPSAKELETGIYTIDIPEVRWPSGTRVPQTQQTLPLSGGTRHIVIRHPSPDTPAGKFDRLQKHTVMIQYHSEPAMALLFNDRKNLGRAPARRTYPYSFSDYQRGYLVIDSMQARWISGAHADSGPIKVYLDNPVHEFTFIRPEHPNLTADLDLIHRAEAAKIAAQNKLLMETHHRKMEHLEKERLQLEKDKLELLKKQQAAEEKERKELLRLRTLEVESRLQQQNPPLE